VADFPFEAHAGGVDDLLGAFDALRPDAVAGDERDDGLAFGIFRELRHGVLGEFFRDYCCIGLSRRRHIRFSPFWSPAHPAQSRRSDLLSEPSCGIFGV